MLKQQEFLYLYMTEGKSYPDIAHHYQIERDQLTKWWDSGVELRSQINRAKQIYNNKTYKGNTIYFQSLRTFVEWYLKQERICFYCGIEERKLQALFDKGGLFKTKRFRGKSLELDRKDAVNNKYAEDNCVLACYLCNNHKSDYISDIDHKKYFAPSIRKFLDEKYNSLNGS